MTSRTDVETCARILREKSKSFALAARLLDPDARDDVAVIYAFCRRVDDAIDLAPPEDRLDALAAVRAEIDDVFARRRTGVVVLDAFSEVAHRHRIPRLYVDELVAGMEMDVRRVRYETLDDLHLYAFRVAGVVGLLLCHVLGLRDQAALPRAAHLGIAMQLTNICRDVAEDLADGRSYVPRALLGYDLTTAPEDTSERASVRWVVRALLDEAARYYHSADLGIDSLPFSSALAVRAARYVYAAIGDRLLATGGDPFAGRAVVPTWKKLLLVGKAVLVTVVHAFRAKGGIRAPDRILEFRDAARLEAAAR